MKTIYLAKNIFYLKTFYCETNKALGLGMCNQPVDLPKSTQPNRLGWFLGIFGLGCQFSFLLLVGLGSSKEIHKSTQTNDTHLYLIYI